MKTELWLVRHWTTEWNLQKRYQGQTDIPLNDAGLTQAEELGGLLSATAFDAIYTSDLQRARQTAGTLAHRLNVPVYPDARLREAHFGDWEGENYFEMKEKYPEIWKERMKTPAWSTGGVSSGGRRRMQSAADDWRPFAGRRLWWWRTAFTAVWFAPFRKAANNPIPLSWIMPIRR